MPWPTQPSSRPRSLPLVTIPELLIVLLSPTAPMPTCPLIKPALVIVLLLFAEMPAPLPAVTVPELELVIAQ
jgi:hypothetical protein